jgi:hypothetical protein
MCVHVALLPRLAPQNYKQPPQLQLSDCPLLLPGGLAAQLPLLLDSSSSSGSPITLQQLQAEKWWTVLPEQLQQQWRRRANSSSWLFTPHIDDLVWPTLQQQQQHEDGSSSSSKALVCALARVVFWARWLLGEPVIVRGIQVGRAVVALQRGSCSATITLIPAQHVNTGVSAWLKQQQQRSNAAWMETCMNGNLRVGNAREDDAELQHLLVSQWYAKESP